MADPALILAEPAQFPRRYVEARAALLRLDQVDECQEWANRAAAMACYARQAKDTTLLDMAKRIQARAIRRIGELLKQTPAFAGRPPATAITRSSVARTAGLTKIQKDTALAVASIPHDEFERVVESDDPPPAYRLREMGRVPGGKRRLKSVKRLHQFADWCNSTEPATLRKVADVDDVQTILAWCTEFLEAK